MRRVFDRDAPSKCDARGVKTICAACGIAVGARLTGGENISFGAPRNGVSEMRELKVQRIYLIQVKDRIRKGCDIGLNMDKLVWTKPYEFL